MNCETLKAKGFSANCRKEVVTPIVPDSKSHCSAMSFFIQPPFLHVVLLHHRRSVKLETLHSTSGNRNSNFSANALCVRLLAKYSAIANRVAPKLRSYARKMA